MLQRLHRAANLQPIAVHATFQYAGTAGKRHRFREGLLFDDPPEYFDPPGGVLSYDAELTDEILSGGEHTLQTHFRLVNHQVRAQAAVQCNGGHARLPNQVATWAWRGAGLLY